MIPFNYLQVSIGLNKIEQSLKSLFSWSYFIPFTVHMLWFIIAPRDEKVGIARRRDPLYNPFLQTEACRPRGAL